MKAWDWIRERFSRKNTAVMTSGGGSAASWSERDFENFAKEAYMKNVIAYACIDKIAKSTSMVPWNISTVAEDGTKEIQTTHPFNNVLSRANPEHSWMMHLYGTVSFLCLAGNTFVQRVAPDTGANAGQPRELWYLRPDRMSFILDPNTGKKVGYEYRVAGRKQVFEIDPVTGQSDIMQIKLFHPTNDHWGLSAVEPSARKIDTQNSLDNWNKKLIDNTGRPGMLLMFKDGLTDKQYERLRAAAREDMEGPANAGRTHILEGATDAKPYGFSPQEMDWINGNLELARSICMAWGVPPQLIGIPDVSTYANFQEARAAFYEDTVMFYLNLLHAEYNAWIFPRGEVQLDYMLDDVPAMQHKRDLRWKRAQESEFLKINEKRALVGYDEDESGDVLLAPANMLPLEDIVNGNIGNDNTDDEDKAIAELSAKFLAAHGLDMSDLVDDKRN